MDHFTVSYSSGGNAIYTDLEDKLEQIFSHFGYELWFAMHDPKTGLLELGFGKAESNGSFHSHQHANAGQP